MEAKQKIKHEKRVPFIEQLQQTECGLCCMSMIVGYYKGSLTLNYLRERMGNGRDGITLLNLKKLAQSIGFDAKCYDTPAEQLGDHHLPAIIFWEGKHFVVLEKVTAKGYYIVDPALGRRKLSLKEFKSEYSRYILTCVPLSQPEVIKRENTWIQYFRFLLKKPKLMLSILAVSIILQLMAVGSPLLIQFVIDNVITAVNESMLELFLIGIILLVISKTVFTFFQGRALVVLQNYLDKEMMTRFFRHMLNLPYHFFQVRSFGDILFRAASLRVIRDLLSNQLLKGVLDVGVLLVIFAYMVYHSIFLGTIVLVLAGFNMLIIYLSRPNISEANQKEIMKNSAVQATQTETLYGIFGIKTAGVENTIYNKWTSQFDELITAYKDKEYILNNVNTATSFLTSISPLIVLFLGAKLVFSGDLTLGGMVAFHAITIQFFGLSGSMVHTINAFILASSYLNRVQDVYDTPSEDLGENKEELTELKGHIDIVNVGFKYSKYSSEVIKNIDLTIKEGTKVALVGKSGSGKSTLSKLLLGLYQPTSGEVYYDGININDLNKASLRKKIGVVPQDVMLLNRSIFENIALHKLHASYDEVVEAAILAQVHDEVVQMPMKYHTIVSEMGNNISGGQRQRIALARALVHKPAILLLDEATSSLDHVNESKIDQYLSELNCTRIVIAHRLTTIMNADLIVVMDNGEIIEQGTHQDLLNNNGYYSSFYTKFQSSPVNSSEVVDHQ